MKKRFLIFVFLLSGIHTTCFPDWFNDFPKDRKNRPSWVDKIKSFFKRRKGDKKASLQELCMRQLCSMRNEEELFEKISKEVPINIAITMADRMRKEKLLSFAQEVLVDLMHYNLVAPAQTDSVNPTPRIAIPSQTGTVIHLPR